MVAAHNIFFETASSDLALLLHALSFAAYKHRDQRRSNRESSPYINHPIDVASIIANIGGVDDLVTLVGAILHDTIEDTETTPDELEHEFGSELRQLVEEVTDDKSLPKAERKRLQVEHAPHISTRAKLIKLGDKICNIRDISQSPPADWSIERRREYLDWTEQVVAGCRGTNAPLEQFYDDYLKTVREQLRELVS
ncbi:MAG TPA: HD domain-containing protein [Pyrinomonadaceae bacterium]|nr:HD domain-containing protein [Pyrinomonadaceae bacterium]